MTFTASAWPEPDSASDPGSQARPSTSAVVTGEIVKISRLVRVQALLVACVVVPFVAAAAFRVQDAVPADSLFGQWVHQSGFALAMVVLGFAGQWVLPAIVCVVAGDVFSAEDRFGTWKTVLTRSRTRGHLFVAKVVAIVVWVLVSWAVITAACLLAALVIGAHAVVGLGGQLVTTGQAAELVTASWAVQLPPMLAFAALAVFFSVVSRNTVVGIGVPVVLGLLGQLSTLVEIPTASRLALPSTAFGAWHGLWVPDRFYGPVWHGVVVSAGWLVVALAASWLVFARRSMRATS